MMFILTDDGWTVKTVDNSLAAHVEDTVVITECWTKSGNEKEWIFWKRIIIKKKEEVIKVDGIVKETCRMLCFVLKLKVDM